MIKVLIAFNIFVGAMFLVLFAVVYLLIVSYTSGSISGATLWPVARDFAPLLGGSLLLIVGAIPSAQNKGAGSVISLVGTSVLTIFVLYEMIITLAPGAGVHNARYMPHFFAALMTVALAADVSAYCVMMARKQ